MKYISTRNKNIDFSFKDIFLRGLAPDGGLFVPKSLKKYDLGELTELYIDTLNIIAPKSNIREYTGARYKPTSYIKSKYIHWDPGRFIPRLIKAKYFETIS